MSDDPGCTDNVDIDFQIKLTKDGSVLLKEMVCKQRLDDTHDADRKLANPEPHSRTRSSSTNRPIY